MSSFKDFTIQVNSEGKRESGSVAVTRGSASIVVSGEAVINVSTEKYRGLHVAVINEQDGSVVQIEHFKTYDQFGEASRFANYIKELPVGRIVAIAICDEGSKYITGTQYEGRRNQEAINACKSLGSTQIEQLNWRDSWTLIGQTGSVKTIQVQEQKNSSDKVSVSALISPKRPSLKKTPNHLGVSARISLTEDYKTDNNVNLISVYRAIVSFPIGTIEAELTAVQDIEVEIDGKRYALNPARPVTVPTNVLGKMVLIKKATELSIPAIKVHTSEMREDESYVICLDQPSYAKIAKLEHNAIADNKNKLNIPEKYSAEQCGHVQEIVTQLAMAYQPTYNYVEGANGVCRDRYIRPHNMDNLHWKYSKDGGVTRLSPDQAHEETKNARVVSTAGQSFLDVIGDAFEKAEEIVVHTVKASAVMAYKQAENVGKTVDHVATNAANTISHIAEHEYKGIVKAGNDLVHGNISGAIGDVIDTDKAVIKDVITGGENIASDVIEGDINALVITFKTAEEEIQYILDHTGKVGSAIKGFLKKIELEIEDFLAWLAGKLGWDDILKVQKAIEQTFNDGMDQMPSIINNLKTVIDEGFKTIKTDLHSNIQQAREYFGANPNWVDQSEHDPATLDKAQEHTDWLMSKVVSDSETSASDNFVVPEPPENLKDRIEGFIKTLSDKVGNDTTLNNAIENLKEDFRDLFQGSLVDAPNKMIMIVLDLAEIIADVAIDIINTVIDALLDCFSDLIKWFQKVVNTPIELPFITDIYRRLTKGDQLTVLNFSSLLIAIPTKFIAEFFGDNLASMIPSASQSLSGQQKLFGYCYAGCQLLNGILNGLLDLEPPEAIHEVLAQQQQGQPIELQPILNGEFQLLPANNDPNRLVRAVNRYENWFNRLNGHQKFITNCSLIIDFFAQIFGSPSGDIHIIRLPKNEKEKDAWACMMGIWAYQWLMWVIDLAFIADNNRPENSEIGSGFQGFFEILHFLAFCKYNSLDSKNHKNQRYNLINIAYFIDPWEGILQMGRMNWCIELTEGWSYVLVPPFADILCQYSYAKFYLEGIKQS